MPYTQAIFRSKSQPPEHHHGIRGIPGIWTAALSGIARARFCRTPPTSPAVQLTADDEFGNFDCDAGLSFRRAASIAAPAAACHALPSGPGRSVRQRPRRPRAGDAWNAAMAAPRDTRRQFPVEASEPAEGDSGAKWADIDRNHGGGRLVRDALAATESLVGAVVHYFCGVSGAAS
jgi:hypothetical protein